MYAATFLASSGLVDGKRLAIRGGSAGGYTTLAALALRDVCADGASYYGIGDVQALGQDTHKFESRYIDRLVGAGVGSPEQMATRYAERSPIHHVDSLRCPVIFFQGLEDKVVPPNQAEAMVAALQGKGIAAPYHAFAGEQHGFRKAQTIETCLRAELEFYGQVFGFSPGGRDEAARSDP
jgi:dipeptidyl aminopeptidase/acylaminoacyl peptidase